MEDNYLDARRFKDVRKHSPVERTYSNGRMVMCLVAWIELRVIGQHTSCSFLSTTFAVSILRELGRSGSGKKNSVCI